VGLALLAVLALCPKCSEPAETLCSASGKSADGTCSTEKDIDEEVEDPDIELKRNYTKIAHTSKYDWLIRDEIDAVEEVLAKEPEKTLVEVESLLAKYPESPRLMLLMVYGYDLMANNATKEETFAADAEKQRNLSRKAIEAAHPVADLFEDMPLEFFEDHQHEEFFSMEYKVSPLILRSVINVALRMAEGRGILGEAWPLVDKALVKDESFKADSHRMQVIMANYYLIHSAGNEEKLMEVVSRGKEEWGQQNKQWGLIEGLALKFTGKNKEGNAILRDLSPSDNLPDFSMEMCDLGYSMEHAGKLDQARTLYSEASKLHIFSTPFKRSALVTPGLETKPVWSLASDAALANYTEAFAELEASTKSILTEAETLIAGMKTESGEYHEDWVKGMKSYGGHGLVASEEASIHVYPLYLYSKKKVRQCSEGMPTACGVIAKTALKPKVTCKVCVTKLVVLDPGFKSVHHTSPADGKLRAILPLQNPEGLVLGINTSKEDSNDRRVVLEENQVTIVDTSYDTVWSNPSDKPAVYLAVDFIHPNLEGENNQGLSKHGEHIYTVW